jgi:hypothetical protein
VPPSSCFHSVSKGVAAICLLLGRVWQALVQAGLFIVDGGLCMPHPVRLDADHPLAASVHTPQDTVGRDASFCKASHSPTATHVAQKEYLLALPAHDPCRCSRSHAGRARSGLCVRAIRAGPSELSLVSPPGAVDTDGGRDPCAAGQHVPGDTAARAAMQHAHWITMRVIGKNDPIVLPYQWQQHQR